MTEKRKKRGGSDSARENNQVGVVAYFSRADRIRIGVAAARLGLTVKAFVEQAALKAAAESEHAS